MSSEQTPGAAARAIRIHRDEASATRLRTILDAEPECIKLVSEDCTLLDMNPAGLAMIEADSLDHVLGKPLLPLVQEEYRPAVRAFTRQIFQGAPGIVEFAITGLKGTKRWLESHGVPLKDAKGEIEAVLCITRDITQEKAAQAERDRALETLRASEAKFRALVEHSYDAVALIGTDSRIQYLSPATQRIVGFAPEEMVGRTMFDFVHPEDMPRVVQEVQEVLTTPGRSKTITGRAKHKDGSWRVIEAFFANLVQNPDVQTLVVNFRDITDRLRAEEALRASEERFQKAFRSNPDSLSISSMASGRFVDVNPAFLKMVGYEQEEVIGRSGAELGITVDPYDRQRILQKIERRESVTGLRARIRRKSGEIREVEFSTEVIDLGGTPCLLVASRDITEAAQLEQKARQVQKMEAIGRLAAGVAHDFNNLLSVIMGYTDLARDHVGPQGPAAEHLAVIKEATERAATLTRQLLAFSRQQVVYPRLLDLNTIVESVGKMLPSMVGEDVKVSIRRQVPLGSIRADQAQIEQVILNLVANARDAMPHGGTITIETMHAELDEAYAAEHPGVEPGAYVMLSVADDGSGMDENTKSQIFEPFFTTKGPGLGTGLGLSTVDSIVQQSNGHIWLYSEPGHGTVFKIYFPLVDQPAEQRVWTRSEQAIGGSETILVVEDDEAVRKMVAGLLQGAGYKVLEAQSGEIALTLVKTAGDRIDLLLTDVVMPGISGGELSQVIPAVQPGMRVLHMSGYKGGVALMRGISPGQILEKPFTKTQLLQKVRSALDNGKDI